MKISVYSLLGLVLLILAGCGNKQMKENKNDIVGIWQKSADTNIAIEFTGEGDYYLRFNGKRVITADSKSLKYKYDSLSPGCNIKIFEDGKTDTTKGILMLMNSNSINFSLLDKDSILSTIDYTRKN